jgi:hypothetical protein
MNSWRAAFHKAKQPPDVATESSGHLKCVISIRIPEITAKHDGLPQGGILLFRAHLELAGRCSPVVRRFQDFEGKLKVKPL